MDILIALAIFIALVFAVILTAACAFSSQISRAEEQHRYPWQKAH